MATVLAVYALLVIVLGESLACTSLRCRVSERKELALSVFYHSRGIVGFIQRMEYYTDGTLRLEAANLKTYCKPIDPIAKRRLDAVLIQRDLSASIGRFGENLRYPSCFIQDTLTITSSEGEATARIDALEGHLLEIAVVLEEEFERAFGKHYAISIVDYATQQECLSANHEVETLP